MASSSSSVDFPSSFYCSSNSTSAQVKPRKYGVFINFRGKDTREGFVSFLYRDMNQRGILAYLDSVELEKGAHIDTIIDAIEDSNIAVVVFSKEYASSSFCLDELVKIMECRQKAGLQVLVVFYRVTPENVENLEDEEDIENPNKSFANAFVTHKKSYDEETIAKWKTALNNVASVAGWDYASKDIRNESDLVEKIVEDILEKRMRIYFPKDLKGLVGMHSRVEDIESLLFSGKVNDVRIVGIWGMGGIGKTTLARAVFDKHSYRFQSTCFLDNVREASENFGLPKLKDELLASLLNKANKSISSSSSSSTFLMSQLQHKKVLIVLDDVDNFKQIESLAGKHEWFGGGSRVIVTSRDRQVLKNGADIQFEVQQLGDSEALRLFSLFAFKQSHPPVDRLELSIRVLMYARGLPLALKVLGLFLHDRSKEEWQSALNELEKTLNMEVEEVLKISYKGLDTSAKEIFLYIACFFRGEPEAHVERILDSCGFSAKIGLSKLVDKALVVISNSNVEMHDLLQEMGREIVRQESIKEPGKRSRLWNSEDILHVFKTNTGTEAIEGISVSYLKDSICVVPTVFSKMESLKILRFHFDNVLECPRGLESLPRELRYLKWDSYPWKALPSNVYFENLVEIDMSSGKIKRLWIGKQNFSRLKVIRMYNCHHLIEMPDFSGALSLEIINFGSCPLLMEVSSSIQYLKNLKELDVHGSHNIKSVPSTGGLRSLTKLILDSCFALEKLSDLSESIEELDLSDTSIKEVPSCSNLRSLRKVGLVSCTSLQKFPELSASVTELHLQCPNTIVPNNLIERLSRLQILSLSFWNGPGNILGIDLVRLSTLRELRLGHNDFEYIPDGIKHLSCLESLGVVSCGRLRSLPELPPHLTDLNANFCRSLEMITESRFALRETSGKLQDFKVNYRFFGCHKLDENARRNLFNHAQQIIRLLAREAFYQLPKSVARKDEVRFVYPENEIPDWINHQSTGSSITVELPRNLCDSKNLLGFVICVVGDKATRAFSPMINLLCECHFESNDAARNLKLRVDLDDPPEGHVLLWYRGSLHQAMMSSYEEGHYFKKATFRFYSNSSKNPHVVSNCGVRLLYIGD